MFFRSVVSDEDGGNAANIAASGASNQAERDPLRAAASNQRKERTPLLPPSPSGGARFPTLAAMTFCAMMTTCWSSVLRRTARTRSR
jgi:hypothetical protein